MSETNTTPMTVEEELTKQLKEILPNLVSAKDILGKDVPANTENIKKLQDQLKNIEGTITKMDSKLVEVGNKRMIVPSTGMSGDEKMDFAKMMINIFKMKKNPSSETHGKILELQKKYFNPNIKAAMQEGTDSEGGYLVPEMFRDQIWRVAEDESIALKECLLVPLTTGYKLPVITGATPVTVAFKAEEAAAGESEPTFGKETISALKLFAYSKVSNELLEDEEVGIVDYLIKLFGEAVGQTIDEEAFTGDGTNFTGVLNASGVNTVTMSSGKGSFDDMDADYLSDMIAQLKRSSLMKAKYYMHRTILNYVRKLKDTTGQYIWYPPAGSEPGTIWGYPYEIVEKMPSSSDSAVSTPFISFGNMKNVLIGTKGDMTVRVSDLPYLLNDQSIVVIRRRLAIAVALPGAFSILKTSATET